MTSFALLLFIPYMRYYAPRLKVFMFPLNCTLESESEVKYAVNRIALLKDRRQIYLLILRDFERIK